MAYFALDDFQTYRDAARYSDRIHALVRVWNSFDSGTVGSQLVRAADSVGANLAESYGRYHYAERVQLFYYARGSAYEAIYWLQRACKRALLPEETVSNAVTAYLDLIASLNKIIKMTNEKRRPAARRRSSTPALAEAPEAYQVAEVLVEDVEAILPF